MSKLLIQEPPLQVLPTLAKTIGLNGAIVIQQLHYWLENPKIGRVVDGEKWVDNSYAEWQENFPFWSVATIKRIFADLEESGFVISGQFDKSDWSQRKSYRIVYETLDSINLTQSSVSNRAALNKELTETTTETAAKAAKPDLVDGVIRYSLGPKDIQRAIAKHFRLTPNWEGNKFNRQWMQWAIQEGVTPAQIERAARAWMGKFNIPPNLKMIQEHWLTLSGEANQIARDPRDRELP